MNPSLRIPLFVALVWFAAALPGPALDTTNTRLVADPAPGPGALVFVYANDLWIAAPDGSAVRRLTVHPGVESGPSLSPDGTLVAFTGRYEGNTDVYVVPSAGGVPVRLTFHPGGDVALGFTPDGKSILFTSPREVYTGRYTQLFTVPVTGGYPTKLPIPNASKAAISPDGRTIAYVPLQESFGQWKHYRGGTISRILLFDLETQEARPLPQPAAHCNDTDPMWIKDALFFRSDRDGEFNVYAFDRGSQAVRRLTHHTDFPVVKAAAGGGTIAYEQGGFVHRLDPGTGRSQPVKLAVAADLIERRPRWVKGAKWIRSAGLSPSGARAVFEFRGEIVTVPREKGDDRNLTLTPAAHERAPAWSPDGKWIALFSDESGGYALHLVPQDAKGQRRTFALDGAGFYADPLWSPDSKKISYTDNSLAIWILDVDSGRQTKVAADVVYGPQPVIDHTWSPDSRWLAYTQNTPTLFNRIFLYSLADGKSHPISDGLANTSSPVFDRSGRYLYFLVSTDSGPAIDWFSQANADIRSVQQIYFAVLAKGVPSPLTKESDEEKPKTDEPKESTTEKTNADEGKADSKADADVDGKAAEKADDKEAGRKKKPSKDTDAKTVPELKFDPDGLAERILVLPVKAGVYADLAAGATNQLFYRRAASTDRGAPAAVFRYDLKTRKEDQLLEAADSFTLSADNKRALLQVKEGWHLVDLGDKLDLAKFKLNLDRIQVKIDPPAEWAQILDEAWRINRDYFYDPGFHGADWPAMRKKYAAFVPDLATRNDLSRVIRWMLSELGVGHSYQSPGDSAFEAETIPGGLLGADFEVANGRYRFRKIYGGLNWSPELRSPLTEPGVDVRAGEYLLAVNGRDLAPPDNLYARFERTAGRMVELTVGANADGSAARTVKVVPVESESGLRNRDWVERNLQRVTEASQGRVAYVYVPNTAELGHTYFKRYFYPQANRQAIIVDERHNGGGSVADYYIDILRRPAVSYWAMRYGADLRTPLAGIQGPKVMLIDETAGSGGDLLPWMFRKFQLGPLVGKRTWGGLVGILGFPLLMDGGSVTAPNLAFWTEDGFRVENEGVAPDVEVEQTPKDVLAGRDPQLEKAIEMVLQELQARPPVVPKRPAYPIRVRAPEQTPNSP